MTRICDLNPNDIKVGMRVKGILRGRLGTITRIDRGDDNYAWITWDGEDSATSGFYGNDCQCEIFEDDRVAKKKETYALRRGHMKEYPDLNFWAEPCVGCFRDENEAIWYFRANHAGCIYTGIMNETSVYYECKPLNEKEKKIYQKFRDKKTNSLPVIYISSAPSVTHGTKGVDEVVEYWMKRATIAEKKLAEIQKLIIQD